MSRIKYITTEIEIDLSEFTDSDLIKELTERGYNVAEEPEMLEMESRWRRGDKKEALILFEREFPGFKGISNLIS